jgi:hypothetical protein
MRRERVGVFKGSPKSWQPLGEVDQKPVEPVFEKSLHTTFLTAFDCQTGRTEVAEGSVQKPVEPVSDPVFETKEQVLIKLK